MTITWLKRLGIPKILTDPDKVFLPANPSPTARGRGGGGDEPELAEEILYITFLVHQSSKIQAVGAIDPSPRS